MPCFVLGIPSQQASAAAHLHLMAAALQEVPAGEVDALKKRKLVVPYAWKTYQLSKGPKFALERRKQATDLTFDMLQKCAP